MNSFSKKNQLIHQSLNTPSIPAVAPPILPRPQILPNVHIKNPAELEENFKNYFFHLVTLYPFSFKRHV